MSRLKIVDFQRMAVGVALGPWEYFSTMETGWTTFCCCQRNLPLGEKSNLPTSLRLTNVLKLVTMEFFLLHRWLATLLWLWFFTLVFKFSSEKAVLFFYFQVLYLLGLGGGKVPLLGTSRYQQENLIEGGWWALQSLRSQWSILPDHSHISSLPAMFHAQLSFRDYHGEHGRLGLCLHGAWSCGRHRY